MLGMGGCGCEIYISVTCPLQFDKVGSAATPLQQKKSNSADVQRGRVNISGFIGIAVSLRLRQKIQALELSCSRGETGATSKPDRKNFILAQQRFLPNPPVLRVF